MTSLIGTIRKFVASRCGNVATTFAFATIPIIGGVGAAIDLSRANAVKVELQTALDSTALMLSRDAATLSSSALQTKASTYFNAMFSRPEASNVSISATYTSSGGSQVVVNGSAVVPTTLVGIVGISSVTVNGTATSKWGNSRLRVALVLDNTGSMADDGKMTALKSATKNLLTQLQSAATTNGDVYVSIIPFARTVNVGTSNKNATWLDWTTWNSVNGSCSNGWGYGGQTQSNCNGTWTPDNHSTWNGCVADRGNSSAPASGNYDQNVTAPSTTNTATLFPTWNDDPYCPVQMMGLSYNWTQLSSLVDSMDPAGGTNQPIGLIWGWNSLVGLGPLTAPAMASGYNYQQIIILLSDGLNTIDRWYGNGSSVSSSVDKRMYDSTNSGAGTCANIKAAGITIYTIQVNTGGDPTSTLLQNCASSTDKFFMLTSSSQIVTTFNTIGTNLSKLRIAY